MASGEEREPIQEAREPTEEELRAAYEDQVKRLRVEHVVLETVVTLANLGMRRTGLAPGTEDERDPGQVRMAIESIRGLMPVVEQVAPDQAKAIRDALSQLQLAFVRIGGEETPSSAGPGGGTGGGSEAGSGSGGPAPGGPAPGQPPSEGRREEPGPAQRAALGSGAMIRLLWDPGQ